MQTPHSPVSVHNVFFPSSVITIKVQKSLHLVRSGSQVQEAATVTLIPCDNDHVISIRLPETNKVAQQR